MKKTLKDRLLHRIKVNDNGCWEWQGCLVRGYGQMSIEGRKREFSHRVSYQIFKGEIPQGHHLDHLCRNPRCVNPDHLEPVSPRENTMRGFSPNIQLHRSGKSRCGHEINAENTCFRKDGTVRHCRICHQAQQAKKGSRFRRAFTHHDIKEFKDDGFAHIRLQYNVPAMRGVRVTFEGKSGIITDSTNSGILVLPDKRAFKGERWQCHPTWQMQYFPTDSQRRECEARRRAFWSIAYPNKSYQSLEDAS